MNDTPTPRTDELGEKTYRNVQHLADCAHFLCGQLERENIKLREEKAELVDALDNLFRVSSLCSGGVCSGGEAFTNAEIVLAKHTKGTTT